MINLVLLKSASLSLCTVLSFVLCIILEQWRYCFRVFIFISIFHLVNGFFSSAPKRLKILLVYVISNERYWNCLSTGGEEIVNSSARLRKSRVVHGYQNFDMCVLFYLKERKCPLKWCTVPLSGSSIFSFGIFSTVLDWWHSLWCWSKIVWSHIFWRQQYFRIYCIALGPYFSNIFFSFYFMSWYDKDLFFVRNVLKCLQIGFFVCFIILLFFFLVKTTNYSYGISKMVFISVNKYEWPTLKMGHVKVSVMRRNMRARETNSECTIFILQW